jgi:hypothetical protein
MIRLILVKFLNNIQPTRLFLPFGFQCSHLLTVNCLLILTYAYTYCYTMRQDRLSGLALLSVHYGVQIDCE